jgi:hypothetical protein
MIRKIVKTVAFFFTFIIIGGISAYLTLTFIIKSEGSVVVPNLIGKNIVYVLELLTDLGLNTKIEGSEYNQKLPKNHVLSQEMEPGTEIKKGRDVRVILSKGPEIVLTPDLGDLSRREAQIVLEEKGLHIGKISNTFFETVEHNLIISQAPLAGTLIHQSENVDLLVSMGPRAKAFKMPDLGELTLDETILLIERNHLLLGEIKFISNKTQPTDIILAQEPAAGNRVFAKSIVTVTINRMPGKNRGHLTPLRKAALFRYRLKIGFLRQRIRIRLNCFGVSNDLYDNYMKPGEEVWLLIPGNKNATVLLYENEKLVKAQAYN